MFKSFYAYEWTIKMPLEMLMKLYKIIFCNFNIWV